ncbi:hypothetical protein B0H12DRAFT_1240206 [Mycena haematopus]|nr:hypothetical protein B0H12DRAFT_1240206 [Mycena haematopus]
MPPHPGYVWREIAGLCELTEILVLLRLSKSINLFLVHLLYRNISVGKSAKKMVASLANNSLLPPLVESIYFTDFLASVDISQWAAVLPALSHLWFLIITPRIPLPPHVIPLITFRLGFFGSISCVDPPWTQLLVSQDRLLRLVITSHFNALDCPGPGKLPLLRSMKGRPADLAKFAFNHRLEDMWFYTGKSLGGAPLHPDDQAKFGASSSRLCTLRICAPGFVSLLRAAPHVVFPLRHLVLDEDLTWSAFTLNSDTQGLGGSSLAPLVSLLDEKFRRLKSVFLVCSETLAHRANRRLITRNDAACFVKFMSGHVSAPMLSAFRFSARDGYASCPDWNEESISYFAPSPLPLFRANYGFLFNEYLAGFNLAFMTLAVMTLFDQISAHRTISTYLDPMRALPPLILPTSVGLEHECDAVSIGCRYHLQAIAAQSVIGQLPPTCYDGYCHGHRSEPSTALQTMRTMLNNPGPSLRLALRRFLRRDPLMMACAVTLCSQGTIFLQVLVNVSSSSSSSMSSCITKCNFTLPDREQTDGESPEFAWALMKTTKTKKRSLLPFSAPPRPASPAMSRRQRRRQREPPVSAAVLPEWPPVAEAQWQQMAHEVSAAVSQLAAGEFSDDDEENLPPLIPLESSDDETQRLAEQREERDKELDRAWDYLISQVSDTIPELHRREWQRDQRRQEELEFNGRSFANSGPLWLDTSTTGYIEY